MEKEISTPYIETDRLILRAWKAEDLPLFAKMNKDARVMRYFPSILTAEQTESFYNRIQSEFKRNEWGLYAVELKSNGTFIGYVGLHEIGFDADFTPGVEIGWRLDADYHNQGVLGSSPSGTTNFKNLILSKLVFKIRFFFCEFSRSNRLKKTL